MLSLVLLTQAVTPLLESVAPMKGWRPFDISFFVSRFPGKILKISDRLKAFHFTPPNLHMLTFDRNLKCSNVVLKMSTSRLFINDDINSKSIEPSEVTGSIICSREILSSFISRLKLYFSDKRRIIGTMKR